MSLSLQLLHPLSPHNSAVEKEDVTADSSPGAGGFLTLWRGVEPICQVVIVTSTGFKRRTRMWMMTMTTVTIMTTLVSGTAVMPTTPTTPTTTK